MEIIIYGFLCFVMGLIGLTMGHCQALINSYKKHPDIHEGINLLFVVAIGLSLAGFVYAILFLEYSGFTVLATIPAILWGLINFESSRGDKLAHEDSDTETLKVHVALARRTHSVAAILYGITVLIIYYFLPVLP